MLSSEVKEMPLVTMTMIGMGNLKYLLGDLVRMKPIFGVAKKYANKIKYDMQRYIPVQKDHMEGGKMVGGGTAMESIRVEELQKDGYTIALAIGTDLSRPDTSGSKIKPFYYPLALEYGTRYLKVGTPESPRRSWASKNPAFGSGRMPFARPAFYNHRDAMIKEIARTVSIAIKKARAFGLPMLSEGGSDFTGRGLRVIR
jgi:hypothetical protein